MSEAAKIILGKIADIRDCYEIDKLELEAQLDSMRDELVSKVHSLSTAAKMVCDHPKPWIGSKFTVGRDECETWEYCNICDKLMAVNGRLED